jgi:uncharacterized protein
VMLDEQFFRLDKKDLDLDVKSTAWKLAGGHRLAAEIGSVQTRDWLDTPSKQRITIENASLALAVDGPADDRATDGRRSPYLGANAAVNTVQFPASPAGFAVPPDR